MHLYVSSITIKGGSDLAEPFEISAADQKVSEGAVVVIDQANPGHLKLSSEPYDTRVAGVVSGANGVNPGIQMQQQGLLEGGKNVALTGRVYVQADTSNGAIKPGDLLTTSSTPGHAMKVTDHARAAGAILGKAMTGLSEGNGMVLLLVTLQ
jgi:UDP-N-acetylmuramyl tripeptide synthase